MNVTLSLQDFEETNKLEIEKLFQIAEPALPLWPFPF